MKRLSIAMLLCFLAANAHGQSPFEMSSAEAAQAASDYQQYCALCHGEDRQGHANDHAPSLRSKSLMEAGTYERYMATAYGRPGTPMAGFSDEISGPLSDGRIRSLTIWLQDQAGFEPVELDDHMVQGDVEGGQALYAEHCSECHGANGEGGVGTALGNPAMLSTTTDPFLRHAIRNGRQGTDMKGFADRLSEADIDSLTAFIRSRATGWEVQTPVFRSPPSPDEYVLNPEGEAPDFALRDNLYVMAADLKRAMDESRRMVLLDTRNMSQWQMAHIEGSVPFPYYYEDVGSLADDLPRDGTWIVTYCECPRAAAEHVNRKLVELGFENTAVLWEGAYGWIGLDYPVSRGDTTLAEVADPEP